MTLSISPLTKTHNLEAPFPLEGGGSLPKVQVAYRTWGNPSRRAILVCHALTGSADVDQWWGGLFGPGKVLDPERHYIVCSNVLGSCYGTTGPTCRRPGTHEPWSANFPHVSVRDMVRLQAQLLDHLGVETLDLVLGGSLGGMQVLEWAALFPEKVRAIAPIAAPAAQDAWAIAMAEAGRQAIEADEHWKGGFYPRGKGPQAGLAAARTLALISYRSPQSFSRRFGRKRQGQTFAMESYLRYQGEKFHQRFDPNTYLLLGDAMNSHDLGRDRGGVEKCLRSLDVPALVVSIDSDLLYPKEEQEELARFLPQVRWVTLNSVHGHDAFLIETQPSTITYSLSSRARKIFPFGSKRYET